MLASADGAPLAVRPACHPPTSSHRCHTVLRGPAFTVLGNPAPCLGRCSSFCGTGWLLGKRTLDHLPKQCHSTAGAGACKPEGRPSSRRARLQSTRKALDWLLFLTSQLGTGDNELKLPENKEIIHFCSLFLSYFIMLL